MKFVFVFYGKILCIGDFPESKCGFFFGKILWIGDFPEFRSGSNHGVTVNSWVEKDWVSRYILRVCFELVWCVSVSAVDFFLGPACSPEGLPMEFGIRPFRFHGEHVGLF